MLQGKLLPLRFTLRTHNEWAGKIDRLGEPFLAAQFDQPLALHLGQGLWSIPAVVCSFVKVAHDLHGKLIADRSLYRAESRGAHLWRTTQWLRSAAPGMFWAVNPLC